VTLARANPGRSMPANPDAEKALLGGIFVDPSVLPTVRARIRPETFFNDVNRRVYAAMLALDDASRPVDLVSVASQLGPDLERIGGNAALMDIASHVPTAAGVGHYAEMIEGLALRRDLIQTAGRIAEEAYEWAGEPLDLLSTAQAKVMRLQPAIGASEMSAEQAGQEAVDHIKAHYEWRQAHPGTPLVTGIPTGIRDLDDLLDGLHPGDLILIGGATSMGKSALASYLAYTAARQYRADNTRRHVAYPSFEMHPKRISMRELAAQTGIAYSRIRRGHLDGSDFARMKMAQSELNALHMHHFGRGCRDMSQIRAECRRLKSQNQLDLIAIDYGQQVQIRGMEMEPEHVRLARVSDGLKDMALELDVPVICVVQLNKNPNSRSNKRAQLGDVGGSSGFEKDADVILFPYREVYYTPDTPTPWLMEIAIAKARDGELGTARVNFTGATMHIRDLTPRELQQANTKEEVF
jgi:replicative DNA helicase